MRRLSLVLVALVWVGLSARVMGASQASRALDVTLPDMRFSNIGLSEAIDFLRDVSAVNIHVNWRALEAMGVTRETPVNVQLRSVTLRKVLSLILSDAAPKDQLTFYVAQGVIEVTTRELADAQMITRTYPVGDLLVTIPNFSPSNSGGLSTGNSSSNGNSGGSLSNQSGGDLSQTATKAERGEALVQLIMEVIRPDVWRPNGGTASIRFFNDNLIVMAPRSVHEAIGGAVE